MLKQHEEWSRRRFSSNRALLTVVLLSVAGLALPTSASADADEQSASQLPAGKQTSLGLYVTAREAYDKWRAAPDEVMILDVRTPEEFLFVGHADMAWNIPLATQSYEWDAAKQQFPMSPLGDFVARVQKAAGPDDVLLVTCCLLYTSPSPRDRS